MNIAFVSSGSSIHVKKIANYLVNHGHCVTLYTLPNHNKLLSDFDNKVKIIKLPFSGKLGYYLNVFKLKKYLKKEKYDLLNCHYASGYGTLARLTKFHPISLAIFGSDIYDYPYKSKFNMKQIIKNLDNADVITSTSNVMRKKVREFYKSDKPIYITPFGVDLNKFKPISFNKDNTFKFGTIKKMEYKYGIDILLRAYKEFLNEFPNSNTILMIYGNGSAQSDFKNLANYLKIEKNVEFRGFIQNELVPKAFSEIDVACFPSVKESESFGVAAVEAMACGIPVIVSDASGFTEVVENNVTGIIIPKNNIEQLKNAMRKVYEMSKEERENMGKNGINRVTKLYNFDNNMEEYVDAIQHCLK